METTWKIYPSNKDVWEAMLEECRSATTSIDFEQFIFDNDEVGKRFIDVCTEKAKQGVRVRFLFDDAGTFGLFLWNGSRRLGFSNALLFSELSKNGIQIAFFNTIIPKTLNNHRWWFFRNHRRSLVIDSKVAFTGSHCILKEVENWRDMSIRMTGPVVSQIEDSFSTMWNRAHNMKVDWGKNHPDTEGGFSYETSAPLPKRRFMYFRLVNAIRSAQSYIYITTPYLIPDHRMLRVLRLAARRGVDIRLILPEATDHTVVDLGGRSYYSTLLRNGVKIYRLPAPILHSKVAVIDGDWGTVGTMNLDRISLRFNFEANIVGTDKTFVSELHQYCRNLMNEAVRVDLAEWEKRSSTQKWLEFLTRFIRQLL
ncbi:MAG: phospholipase D/transphosphatidylase, cardiolipin synthase [Candidatus Taylorbacteria bacterium]|nr:phospholipase D/transphosphatidylase, cardiolipin synthase [Candidatus Taylorbacteria bacterium]